jgi:hypothetical protein
MHYKFKYTNKKVNKEEEGKDAEEKKRKVECLKNTFRSKRIKR